MREREDRRTVFRHGSCGSADWGERWKGGGVLQRDGVDL